MADSGNDFEMNRPTIVSLLYIGSFLAGITTITQQTASGAKETEESTRRLAGLATAQGPGPDRGSPDDFRAGHLRRAPWGSPGHRRQCYRHQPIPPNLPPDGSPARTGPAPDPVDRHRTGWLTTGGYERCTGCRSDHRSWSATAPTQPCRPQRRPAESSRNPPPARRVHYLQTGSGRSYPARSRLMCRSFALQAAMACLPCLHRDQ